MKYLVHTFHRHLQHIQTVIQMPGDTLHLSPKGHAREDFLPIVRHTLFLLNKISTERGVAEDDNYNGGILKLTTLFTLPAVT